jgi:uncharacterized membrane protein (DUF373 family)
VNAIKNWLSDDGVFQQGLLRFQRVLAKVLAVAMVVVIIAATLQLLTVLAWEVAPAQFPFLVSELEMVLGQVLELLIAIEVLENITAYLKDHHIQVELVLATAMRTRTERSTRKNNFQSQQTPSLP